MSLADSSFFFLCFSILLLITLPHTLSFFFSLSTNSLLHTTTMSAYNYETVKVSFPAPFVAHVELNRPKKLNAINDPMWTDIGAVFNQLRDDENVRAIVLSGSGRCFTSGLDRTFSRATRSLHTSLLGPHVDYLPSKLIEHSLNQLILLPQQQCSR